MAQGWAGFSEEELRRLKQNKGNVCARGRGAWSLGRTGGLAGGRGGVGPGAKVGDSDRGSPGGCVSSRGQRGGLGRGFSPRIRFSVILLFPVESNEAREREEARLPPEWLLPRGL